jgi:hypothetical protein
VVVVSSALGRGYRIVLYVGRLGLVIVSLKVSIIINWLINPRTFM